MAKKDYDDKVFWEQIEWIFKNTLEFQDERNFTLLLFSFSKYNFIIQHSLKEYRFLIREPGKHLRIIFGKNNLINLKIETKS